MKLLKYIFFTAAILMSSLAIYAGETVKYVFLFIGDGMSIPQRMTAEEFSRINTGKGLAMNSMDNHPLKELIHYGFRRERHGDSVRRQD